MPHCRAIGEDGGQLPSLSNAISGQITKRIHFCFPLLDGPVQDVTTLLEIPCGGGLISKGH